MADGELDACDIDFTQDPTPDEDLAFVVLFAGVPADRVDGHADAWRQLFGGQP